MFAKILSEVLKKLPTISLVIPVYNEESHLAACLRTALAQRLPFAEIIVIDNNSSDNSVAIAESFAGVQVIHERQQGVVHARTRGFNAARSAIIARIDADTLLPVDWTEQLQTIFADQSVAACSGKMEYYDIAMARTINRIDLGFRRHFTRVLGRRVALQAANMAIRRTAWHQVKTKLCAHAGIHEDFDLAIHLERTGKTVIFDERLVAAIGFRQADTSYKSFRQYAYVSPRTYHAHGLKREARYMYPAIGLVIVSYGLLRTLHQGYDPTSNSFSLVKLVSPTLDVRVNPATFVD